MKVVGFSLEDGNKYYGKIDGGRFFGIVELESDAPSILQMARCFCFIQKPLTPARS